MATADSVLRLISFTVENAYGPRSAGVCWIISTAILQDTFAVLPAITSCAEKSLQGLQANLMHFIGPIWDHNKWLDSDKYAQLTADIFTAMVTYDYSNVVIRALGSFQSAEAIRKAIPTAGLLGMVFSSCGGGVGHWNSIDAERAREFLGRRDCAGVCVSRVR